MGEFVDFVMQGHLGGYFAGGDPDCMYPEMWQWLINECDISTVLDVGCGDGSSMRVFRDLGASIVIGIDGVAQEDPLILRHDFTDGPLIWRGDPGFDLVWSCEFVEHVDAAYIDNFMDAMVRAPLVLMTHAVPGQGGHHHVNCQEQGYWRNVFDGYGYELDAELTAESRNRASSYYAATGMAFRRQK